MDEWNVNAIAIQYFVVVMDTLVQNPGLDHLAIDIFAFLDPKSLAQCALVSKSWKNFICSHKMWWIAKLSHLKGLLKLPRISRFRNRNECTDLINTFIRKEQAWIFDSHWDREFEYLTGYLYTGCPGKFGKATIAPKLPHGKLWFIPRRVALVNTQIPHN